VDGALERDRSGPHRVRPPSGGVRCWRSNSGDALPALMPVLPCGDHDIRERSPCRALYGGVQNDRFTAPVCTTVVVLSGVQPFGFAQDRLPGTQSKDRC
jgi:hypothetical protein